MVELKPRFLLPNRSIVMVDNSCIDLSSRVHTDQCHGSQVLDRFSNRLHGKLDFQKIPGKKEEEIRLIVESGNLTNEKFSSSTFSSEKLNFTK